MLLWYNIDKIKEGMIKMVRPTRTKSSKFRLSVGWAIVLYCDTIEEINDYIRLWGSEKCSYERLERGNK